MVGVTGTVLTQAVGSKELVRVSGLEKFWWRVIG